MKFHSGFSWLLLKVFSGLLQKSLGDWFEKSTAELLEIMVFKKSDMRKDKPIMPSLKFSIQGATLSGEWDEANKLVFIDKLAGDLVIDTQFIGSPVNVRGTIDTAMDNCVRVKINSVRHVMGQLPSFLIPGILNMLRNFNSKFAAFASVERDMILIDPGRLLPDNTDFKVFIQPGTLEIPEQKLSSLRERILIWAEANGGSVAKELVEIILAIPDLVMLLFNLAKDPRISAALKLRISLCIAYVVWPLDLIPEALTGALGFVDDAAAIGLMIAGLAAEIPTELIREHWKGRPEILELLLYGQGLAAILGKLPEGVLQKLVSLFGKEDHKTPHGR